MKKIISLTIVSLAYSTMAFASTDALYSDYDQALYPITVNNACLSDGMIRTKNPISLCNHLVAVETPSYGETSGQTDWVCDDKGAPQHVFKSRDFKRSVCVDLQHDDDNNLYCRTFGEVDDKIPTTIKTLLVKDATGTKVVFPGIRGEVTLTECPN